MLAQSLKQGLNRYTYIYVKYLYATYFLEIETFTITSL